MKMYRLKEEVKKYFNPAGNTENELDIWLMIGWTEESLEEVDKEIKVSRGSFQTQDGRVQYVEKLGGDQITDKELSLTKKAWNGELFTKNEMVEFSSYVRNASTSSPVNCLNEWMGIKKSN